MKNRFVKTLNISYGKPGISQGTPALAGQELEQK